jgi:hypothetical protein
MTVSTVIPAVYDLPIPQRATLRETIRLPFNGTGKTAFAQIWKDFKRRTLILQLDIAILATSPKLTIELQAEWNETRLITKSAVWDLLIVNADGTREHWVTGEASLSEAVTEAAP